MTLNITSDNVFKNLSISFQWKTRHTEVVMCICVWLEQSNTCAKYRILSDENIRFTGENL